MKGDVENRKEVEKDKRVKFIIKIFDFKLSMKMVLTLKIYNLIKKKNKILCSLRNISEMHSNDLKS